MLKASQLPIYQQVTFAKIGENLHFEVVTNVTFWVSHFA